MTEKSQPETMSRDIVVLALYQFLDLPDYRSLQPLLLALCRANGLCGTLLLAPEGINGTVAGSRQGIDALRRFLKGEERFAALEWKESCAHEPPFHRMKVKLKREIVTMGVPGIVPQQRTGTRVAASDWNSLISEPDVFLVDARNQYEYEVGTFHGAASPETETFREFPDYVDRTLDPSRHKRVAMFCTGGIRCEKASAYLLERGFEEVFQLDGGILRYLEEVEERDSLWEGACFVFDGRVAVNHALEQGEYIQCHACRHPLSQEDVDSGAYEEGVSCPHCVDRLSDAKRAGCRERQRQVRLASERKVRHIGALQPASSSMQAAYDRKDS